MTNDYSLLNVQFVSPHIIDLLQGMRIALDSKFVSVKIIACLLGAFAKLRKATISFVMSVRLFFSPSVCPHGTTRLPLDSFS